VSCQPNPMRSACLCLHGGGRPRGVLPGKLHGDDVVTVRQPNRLTNLSGLRRSNEKTQPTYRLPLADRRELHFETRREGVRSGRQKKHERLLLGRGSLEHRERDEETDAEHEQRSVAATPVALGIE
jgi:hypothetical protein